MDLKTNTLLKRHERETLRVITLDCENEMPRGESRAKVLVEERKILADADENARRQRVSVCRWREKFEFFSVKFYYKKN
jgi:hypothetical protein